MCNIFGLISHLKPLSCCNTTAPMLPVNQKRRGNISLPYLMIVLLQPQIMSFYKFECFLSLHRKKNSFFSCSNVLIDSLLPVLLGLHSCFWFCCLCLGCLCGCARPASAVMGNVGGRNVLLLNSWRTLRMTLRRVMLCNITGFCLFVCFSGDLVIFVLVMAFRHLAIVSTSCHKSVFL